VERAREQAAHLLNAEEEEIVWTSGATESDNLALVGAAEMARERGDHIVTCATEHRAVLDPLRYLSRAGFRVSILEVDSRGEVDLDALRSALSERTVLVSIMAANNEIGTIHPLREIARTVREGSSALLHTDAAQAAGLLSLDTRELDVDLLSLSAHKIHGPKGVGALFVRRRRPRLRLTPLLRGGGHEHGLRSGSPNVPGIVGCGAALEIAHRERENDARHCRELRDELERRIRDDLPDIEVNGDPRNRLPNNLNLYVPDVSAADLLLELNDVALSTGAACSSATLEPSHVIAALGHEPGRIQSSVRFGLSKLNTVEEVRFVAARVVEAVRKLCTAQSHRSG
jgi:cysteine desulfurase